jgi:hypothetical protein
MRCSLSRWVERKKGWRCRVLTCPGRKISECVQHEWWKESSFPDAATRPSVVCRKDTCKEAVLRTKPPSEGQKLPRALRFSQGGKKQQQQQQQERR